VTWGKAGGGSSPLSEASLRKRLFLKGTRPSGEGDETMRVAQWMKKDPITISPETGVWEAARLLRQYRIRHLPVVKRGKLVGIVTDRDVKRVLPSPATSLSVYEVSYLLDRLEVKEVMTKEVITVGPLVPIEEAAKIMHDRKIGCLPVLEGEALVGIITETDLLAALVEVMGVREPSSRLEIELPDTIEALAEVVGILQKDRVAVSNLLAVPSNGRKVLVLRVKTIDPSSTIKTLQQAGYRVSPSPG